MKLRVVQGVSLAVPCSDSPGTAKRRGASGARWFKGETGSSREQRGGIRQTAFHQLQRLALPSMRR